MTLFTAWLPYFAFANCYRRAVLRLLLYPSVVVSDM